MLERRFDIATSTHAAAARPLVDLSKTDFEALRRRSKESKHRNTDLEILKVAIQTMLERLIRLNSMGIDFQETFEHIYESYPERDAGAYSTAI